MARLPQPGADDGNWGDLLNDFLRQVHSENGQLKSNIVTAVQLSAGSVTNPSIQDSTISENKLAQPVKDKLNALASVTGGRELELQANSTHIQWRYVGDSTWTNLVALDDIRGIQGLQGPQGDKGDKGDKGDTGAPGVQGVQGEVGPAGPIGPQGLQGEPGVKGDTGVQGAQGVQGDKGDKGDKGNTGDKGDKGDKGDTGDQGIQGEVGPVGSTGPQGPQGPKGDKGDTGAPGTTDYNALANKPDLDARDTANRNRANHTGTQSIATIDGLQGVLDGKQATGDYATNSSLTSGLAGKQDALVSGTSIKTINGNSLLGSGNVTISTGGTIDSVNGRTGIVTGLAESSSLTAHTSSTSNPHSVTKAQIGLGNADNTSDANKPISTATQTALDSKANTSHTHALADLPTSATANRILRVGTANSTPAYSQVALATDVSGTLPVANGGSGRTTATTAYGLIAAGTTATGVQQTVSPGTSGQVLKSNGASALPTFQALAKADVGLANVDNTADSAKPVSIATQAALDNYLPIAQPINAQTGASYTLVAADAGKLVTYTRATAATVTVPASTLVAGQRVDIAVLGAGMVTFVGSGGMTLTATPSLTTRATGSAVSVVVLSATTALVVGDLA